MKNGFTLAEVLITLAIIGVVAALTIPAVVYKYQQNVLYTQFVKVMSDLNRVYQLSVSENGAATSWFPSNSVSEEEGQRICYHDFIKRYFSLQQECAPRDENCFASNYRQPDNTINNPPIVNGYSAILNNGVSLLSYHSIVGDGKTYLTCVIYVDTNGKKGPNAWGRDLFWFYINKDYNVVEPHYRNYNSNTNKWNIRSDLKSLCEMYGRFCGGYLLQNGKMDY